MKISHNLKYLLLLLLPIILILFYWLKFQIGIDIFNSFSVGNFFPLKYLKNDIIASPDPGIILSENFNDKKLFKEFSPLFMREKGTVKDEISPEGYNGSKCLLIKNTSTGSWNYSHRKKVKVKKGDLFHFEGLTKLTGIKLSANFCVVSFNINKDVIDYNLVRRSTNRTGEWIRIETQFYIQNDTIRYIKFRLTGRGKGNSQFDNIIFRKLN